MIQYLSEPTDPIVMCFRGIYTFGPCNNKLYGLGSIPKKGTLLLGDTVRVSLHWLPLDDFDLLMPVEWKKQKGIIIAKSN